jgi:hypothetical protein
LFQTKVTGLPETLMLTVAVAVPPPLPATWKVKVSVPL